MKPFLIILWFVATVSAQEGDGPMLAAQVRPAERSDFSADPLAFASGSATTPNTSVSATGAPTSLSDALLRLAASERENGNLALRLGAVLAENRQLQHDRSLADAETIARVGRQAADAAILADALAERNRLREDVSRLRDLLEATGRLRSLDLAVENDDLQAKLQRAQTDLAHLSGILFSKGIDVAVHPMPQTNRLLETNSRLSQQNTLLVKRVGELEEQARASAK